MNSFDSQGNKLVGAYISKELYAKLRVICAVKDCSVSAVIRSLLIVYCKDKAVIEPKKEENVPPTLEAA